MANIYSRKSGSTSYHLRASEVICESYIAQKMDSPASCATSCAMPTAIKSKHSSNRYATSTLQCYMLPICYIVLSEPPLKKLAPSHWGYPSHQQKSSSGPLTHHHKWHNWHTFTELLLLLVMNLQYLNMDIDECTTRNQHVAYSSSIGRLNSRSHIQLNHTKTTQPAMLSSLWRR